MPETVKDPTDKWVEETDEPAEKPAEQVVTDTAPKEEAKAEDKPKEEEKKPLSREENLKIENRRKAEEIANLKAETEKVYARLSELEKLKEELDVHRKARQDEQLAKELETNPVGYFHKEIEGLKAQAHENAEQQQKRQQAEAQQAQFINVVRSQTDAYTKQNPNYPKAFEYARNRRLAEYEVLGVPPEQREAMLLQESLNLSVSAIQQGRNPAEVLWNLASSWGFKSEEEKKDIKPEDKITQIEEGMKASKTLSKDTKSEESQLKKWEEMDDEEFDKEWKKMSKEAKGGR